MVFQHEFLHAHTTPDDVASRIALARAEGDEAGVDRGYIRSMT